MAVLYQNNWNSATPGATMPTGWQVLTGAGFSVVSGVGIGGSNAISFVTTGHAYQNGIAAFRDGKVSFEYLYSTTLAPRAPGIRINPAGGGVMALTSEPSGGVYTCYLFHWSGTGWDLQGGAQSLTIPGTPANGDVMKLTLEADGNDYTYSLSNGATTTSVTWTLANADEGFPAVHGWFENTMVVDNYLVEDLEATLSYEVTGPSGGLVNVASTNFTIAVTGDLLASTIFTPSDGGQGGAFTPSTVTLAPGTNPSGTFTYTPVSTGAKTITVTNNGGITQAPSDIYTVAALATTYTMTGPGSGTTGSPSTAFTITITGVSQSTIVFTPSAADGTFSPSTVSIGAGTNGAGTFTYTPATSGTKTISVTNNGGLTNPANLSYIASSGPITVPVDSDLLGFSPGNWDLLEVGDYGVSTLSKQTGSNGAYMKFQVSNCTDVDLLIDPSISTGATTAPTIRWSINDQPINTVSVTNQTSIALLDGAVSATRRFQVWIQVAENIDGFPRWNPTAGTSISNAVRIQGVRLSLGAGIQNHPLLRTKKGIMFGDSITEGTSAGANGVSDPMCAYPVYLGDGLKVEYGQEGYGGQGWERDGFALATFLETWNYHSAGRPRTLTGFDYVFVCHGTNDFVAATPSASIRADVAQWLDDARTGFGANTWIVILSPPGGFYQQALQDGVADYLVANPTDEKVAFVSVADRIGTESIDGFEWVGASYIATDGIHLNSMGHAKFGSAFTGAILEATIESTPGPGVTLEPSFGFIG